MNTLQQIVRLKQMLRKWRRVARMGGGKEEGVSGQKVPAGHVAVYVGTEERVRFVVKTAHLNHAIFAALLKRSQEEFGFRYEGPLAIPCDALFFQHLLSLLDSPSASPPPDLLDFYKSSSSSLSSPPALHAPHQTCAF